LVLVERVMPECMTASAAHQRAAALDMRMLTITGGIERTEEEYRQLLGRVGFNLDADDRARAAIGTSHSRSRASAPSARFGCKVARKDFYSASERQLSAIVAPKPPFSFRPFAVRRPPKRTFPFGRKPRAKESPALITDEARLVRY
jgi:hypothetical protein